MIVLKIIVTVLIGLFWGCMNGFALIEVYNDYYDPIEFISKEYKFKRDLGEYLFFVWTLPGAIVGKILKIQF